MIKVASQFPAISVRRYGQKRLLRVLIAACLVLPVAACNDSSDSAPGTVESNTGLDDPAIREENLPLPYLLHSLSTDTQLITDIPEVIYHQTMADSGLQIAYTRAQQWISAPADYIDAQWQHMLRCLAQLAVAPLILVNDGAVQPLTQDDLVLFQFGLPMATATLREGTVMQINESDLNGTLEDNGFYLRSILGRYLWLSANLSASDYPYSCAAK